MNTITFITGNQDKADYLAKYLGFYLEHMKLDLDEIQSLDLREVIEHKVRQAYLILGKPVIVEDTSLEFTSLGRLPGTFIKFFWEELGPEMLCNIIVGPDRTATARSMFGYFDGENLRILEGTLKGKIANKPAGDNGYGWDKVFIPIGKSITRASLDDEEYQKSYTTLKPFAELKQFLESVN
jgi:non-canonical purine NTP pyrophosphatase (RdgB/HAM1 family)